MRVLITFKFMNTVIDRFICFKHYNVIAPIWLPDIGGICLIVKKFILPGKKRNKIHRKKDCFPLGPAKLHYTEIH